MQNVHAPEHGSRTAFGAVIDPPKSLDHVALWVDRREEIGDFLCRYLGMHEIESSDEFALYGVDALEGKITLFSADGPRHPGSLGRIVLRVKNLGAALQELPSQLEVTHAANTSCFDAPGGLPMGLVERSAGLDFDIDHVVLRVNKPKRARRELVSLGFTENDMGELTVSNRAIHLQESDTAPPNQKPILNHIALLVNSVHDYLERADDRGIPVEKTKDAPNTYAAFVRTSDGILLEYVEHKPGFALK